jgi:hypothetical protein
MDVQDVLPRDAIPSIDDPAFGGEYFGDDGDGVVVVDGEPPRAYPIRVLSYHEIVNDRGRGVAVTWCPICGSAVVYERRVGDRSLTFGVSGKLADDGLVMYDRETETEWHQPTGEAMAGPLAGERLTVRPAAVTTYGEFRAENPGGEVLQPVGEREPGTDPWTEYDMERYEAYFEGEAFGLYGMRGTGEPRAWDRTDLDPKTVVLGVEHGGAAVGYPLSRVEGAGGVVSDTVGGRAVVVCAVGSALLAVADPGFGLRVEGGELRGGGTTWEVTTGRGADGRRLDRLPSRRLFAFAWQDAHGPDSFYG